jgi:hypothetical protein
VSDSPRADSPLELYGERLEQRKSERRRRQRQDFRLSTLRGVVALIGVASCAGTVAASGASAVVLVLTLFVFGALVLIHERVARASERAARAVAYYEAGRARLRDEWAGRGVGGEAFLDPAHPYAADLDLFGRGSLFERLCTARTRSGEELLASWLLAPAPIAEVAERQAAVEELRPRLDLREDLAVLGGEARRSVDSSALRDWVQAPVDALPAVFRALAVPLAVAALAALWNWLVWGASPYAFIAAFIAVSVLGQWARPRTTAILRGIDQPARDLATLADLLSRLERERFEGPRLRRLWEAFGAGDAGASLEIARLRRLVELRDSKHNLFFAPFAFLLSWDVHIAAAVSHWRRRAGGRVAASLHALAEVEALCAFAAYGFENPADPFPAFEDGAPLFDASGLGHPLIAESRAVRNDVRFDAERRLLVVSGSNMSGKSTLLRAIGLNAVLAQAGAPVRARSLALSPLMVGASIRIVDSLQEGRSRFYTEIKRVRQVIDLAGGRPWLLFLLDEIFHGTNSADRVVGAEAVVRTLVERGAIGLVTSHDLAITEIARDLAPAAANVHFEDHLEGDTIAFDYRLKPGPVQRGNALGLMRAVGLEV